MILHIVIDDKFIDIAYRVFEEVFPNNNVFLMPTESNQFHYIKTTPIHTVPLQRFLSDSFIQTLLGYEMVILHWMDDIKLQLISRAPDKVKFLWIGWGADYYDIITRGDHTKLLKPLTQMLSRSLGSSFSRQTRSFPQKLQIIKRIDYFSPVLREDYELVKAALPEFRARYVSWNYGTLEDDFSRCFEGLTISGNNILLGNSATPENNHIDAFELIKKLGAEGRQIITPLSYGDLSTYRDSVIKYGKECFGEHFVPIVDFMPVTNYIKFISSCSVAIMNHIRQQALGNIIIMMHLGTKVFLDKQNPVYNFFKKEGAFIFSLEELPDELNIPLSPMQIEHNRTILKAHWSREAIHDKTKSLLAAKGEESDMKPEEHRQQQAMTSAFKETTNDSNDSDALLGRRSATPESRSTPLDNFLNPVLSPENMDIYFGKMTIRNLLNSLIPSLHGIMLDVGCGEMRYKPLILQNEKITQYIGLDIDNPMYQKEVKPDIFWDGLHIPLDDNHVDCAIATEVLEHCPNPGKVLAEVCRVLKPNGLFFFTVPFFWPLHDVPHDEYRYTPFSLKRLLDDNGYFDIEIKALGGWHASLAQMIGLWVRRAPLTDFHRKEYEKMLFPFYQELLQNDRIPNDFHESFMTIGFSGMAKKKS